MTGWKAQGKTLREIASELNRLAIRTPRGSQWYASTVRKQIAASSATGDPASGSAQAG